MASNMTTLYLRCSNCNDYVKSPVGISPVMVVSTTCTNCVRAGYDKP